MYKAALELMKEIFSDTELNDYVKEMTGKNLTVFTSGPRLNTPAVAIEFAGSDKRGERVNSIYHTIYRCTFIMSFFGSDGFEKCHDLLDKVVEIIFNYEVSDDNGASVIVQNIEPSMIEKDPERDWWTLEVLITVGSLTK